MRINTLCYCVTIASFLLISCSVGALENINPNTSKTTSLPETKIIETKTLELINEHRDSLGLNLLKTLTTIKVQAYLHTDYMLTNNQVSHHNFLKRSANLKRNSGAIVVSENVAYAYNSSRSVYSAWLRSESHKKIIEGEFTHFDISAERDQLGYWYFTNIFIKK